MKLWTFDAEIRYDFETMIGMERLHFVRGRTRVWEVQVDIMVSIWFVTTKTHIEA